jgi:hypothetical protein
MKRYTVWILALVFVLAAAVFSHAQEDYFTGVVLAVDADGRSLSIEQAGLEATRMTFSIPSEATLQKGQRELETITLQDIEVGDPVRVHYQMSGERTVVQSVQLITMPSS